MATTVQQIIETDLNVNQKLVLIVIIERPSCNQQLLARHCSLSYPHFRLIIKRLIELGLITTVRDSDGYGAWTINNHLLPMAPLPQEGVKRPLTGAASKWESRSESSSAS